MAAVVRYYGAKKDSDDPRDHHKVYTEVGPLPTRGPLECYVFNDRMPMVPSLCSYVDHVYDQGSLGSCTANAVCAAYGFDLKKQEATLSGGYSYFDSSRLFLYYNTREYEGNEGTTQRDAGTSIRDTIKSINREGVCKETDWPYSPLNYEIKPPPAAYQAAKGNTVCKYERLTQNIDQFRACLQECPFVFGFKVYPSFHTIGKSGVMPMPKGFEREENLHAVMAVQYNDSGRYFIVLNSWGSDWGRDGFFNMPYNFITDPDKCFDFWKIAFSSEKGIPKPKNPGVRSTARSGGRRGGAAKALGYGGACGYSSSSGYRGRYRPYY